MSQLIQFEGCTHYAVGIEEFEEMEAEIESLRAQVAEFEHSFQLQWDASQRAIKMWHDDGNDDMKALRADAESHRMRMKNCDCQQEVVALNRELTDRLNGIEHKLGAEKQAREAAESRLRELRVAIGTIKSIVTDRFLNHREKLEVIESRCDIELCTDALAKSAES